MTFSIIQELNPDSATIAVIEEGLRSYNSAIAGTDNMQPLWCIGRDDQGTICGGLKGVTFYNWLFVAWLWVGESYRHQGHGSALLSEAEKIAKERGCQGVFLDTYSFQAPDFYARHGYKECGRLDNIPFGHMRIWLSKAL